MECSRVRERLSAYLENAVSPEDRGLIGEHLESCSGCSADLADLRKTIEHIKGLEEVEPPAWLTQKIMAGLRGEARRKKGILWRLFHPLHIKLPLEAVAAILVIGIALYIYRGIGPDTRLIKASPEKSAPQILKKEMPGKDRLRHSGESKKVPPEGTAAPARPAQGQVSGKKEEKADRIKGAPNAPQPPRPMPLMQEKQEAAPSTPANEAAPYAADAVKKNAEREAVQASPKLKAFSQEKMESPVLTVKVGELEGAGKEVERIVAALGGKIIERQSHEDRSMFAIDLNADKFEELFEKLKAVGEVKETEPEVKGREGEIRLRIEVMEKPQLP